MPHAQELYVAGYGDVSLYLSSGKWIFGICPLVIPYYHTHVFKKISRLQKDTCFNFHIMNSIYLYLIEKLISSYMGYSNVWLPLFNYRGERTFVEAAVIFRLDQNPFCKGQKTSQTCTIKGLFDFYGIPLFPSSSTEG